MSIKAVLFDFDGVIADTLTYHVCAWQTIFHNYGIDIFPEDIYLLEGRTANEIARQLSQKKGLTLSDSELKQITERKRATYRKITRAKIYPETEKLIDDLLKAKVKIAMVTGSIIPNVAPVVGNEFLKKFDTIVTGDQVKNSKPDPEPFLTAARKLAIKPEECLVIENAPSGIKAAKRAGMFCVAVKTTIKDNHHLREADLIVEDVSKIPIKELLRSG